MSEQFEHDVDQTLTEAQAELLLQRLCQLGDCGLRKTMQLLAEKE